MTRRQISHCQAMSMYSCSAMMQTHGLPSSACDILISQTLGWITVTSFKRQRQHYEVSTCAQPDHGHAGDDISNVTKLHIVGGS